VGNLDGLEFPGTFNAGKGYYEFVFKGSSFQNIKIEFLISHKDYIGSIKGSFDLIDVVIQ
jgi:hypothetical protein